MVVFRSVLAGNRYYLQFLWITAFKSSFANISEWEKWGSQREPGGPPGRGPMEGRRGPGRAMCGCSQVLVLNRVR